MNHDRYPVQTAHGNYEWVIMTRRVVGYEGKPSVDKRLILPGTLTVKASTIPVMKYLNGGFTPTIIGKATDFERDVETGALSFDINTENKLSEELNTHMYCDSMEYHYDSGVMIIEAGIIRGISVSDAPSAWPLVDDLYEKLKGELYDI